MLSFVCGKKSGGMLSNVESEQWMGVLAQAVLEGRGEFKRRAGW